MDSVVIYGLRFYLESNLGQDKNNDFQQSRKFHFGFLFLSVKISMVPGELRLKIFKLGLKIPC